MVISLSVQRFRSVSSMLRRWSESSSSFKALVLEVFQRDTLQSVGISVGSPVPEDDELDVPKAFLARCITSHFRSIPVVAILFLQRDMRVRF